MQGVVEEALCGGPLLARRLTPRVVDEEGQLLQDVAWVLGAAGLTLDQQAKSQAARCDLWSLGCHGGAQLVPPLPPPPRSSFAWPRLQPHLNSDTWLSNHV
jgi:hypothetical protein